VVRAWRAAPAWRPALAWRAALPAIVHVRDHEREHDRDFDEGDHAEAGRERDRDDRQNERGDDVLEQVAAAAREHTLLSSALQCGCRRLLALGVRRLVLVAAGG
jgi:hypothetical protein